MRAELDINWEHYEEHLDEAAFLWSQWERALVAPDYVLHEVLADEERLLARMDALRLGGATVAEQLLVPALQSDEAERLSAAALVLLTEETPAGGGEAVRTALDSAEPPALAAIRRALEVLDTRALPAWVPDLLERNEAPLQALGLEVMRVHGVDPGPRLSRLLDHAAPQVLAAALRASGRLGHRVELGVLARALDAPLPEVRDAAIEVGLLQGRRAAWAACQQAVEARAPRLRLPALLLALGGDERDLERLRRLLAEPEHRPDALWALGFSGRVSSAGACLEWLADPRCAPLAAEALGAITGLRLEGSFVMKAEEPGEEEDDPDKDLSPRPEDALPRPHAGAVAAWWSEHRKQFEPERRYLHGRPFTPALLQEALVEAPMRRRQALALELTLRSRGAFWPPTQAPGPRQLAALRALRAAPPEAFSRSFTEGLHA
ncbi:TIGR02270 family protein [Pyxidicoccus trucidator]|uniref:TIGR02270 family protein n=1 Tax=Pyxidicoccus trucidator TaxID=2709662 RepID=UPI0013DD7A74|nr:TIGR02270 family protein [Pyxidicoccus trucidator]